MNKTVSKWSQNEGNFQHISKASNPMNKTVRDGQKFGAAAAATSAFVTADIPDNNSPRQKVWEEDKE